MIGTIEKLRRELSAYVADPSIPQLVYHLCFVQGYQANVLYRISHKLYERKSKLLGKAVARLNYTLTHADISGNAKIDDRVFFPHPSGIVIGEHTTVGKDCVILHGVTLGSKHIERKDENRHPVIGDNVSIGCNASVLGNVNIPSDTKVRPHEYIEEPSDS